MTVIDLITRVDAICKKYDKYDIDKQKAVNVAGDDAFARLYGVVDSEIDAALQKSEAAATEKNRATAVKGISKEELEARNDLVYSLKDRIDSIPDGSSTATKQSTGGWATSTSSTGIKFDSSSDERFTSEYFQQTEESDRFRQEYEMRRMRQDQGLEVIAEGLDTLKDMAHDMNEELDRQVPLMDEIDDKVDRATSDLKSTNVRLKDTVHKCVEMRQIVPHNHEDYALLLWHGMG
ncbi:hypothetical protein GOBAR_AA04987 [Gossypium barbadense]|uniref:t-SNARE coiled-coil homology domain-containing protein n=1 Tax=Gossypium barbadense TaxID=3634 RepID=A0A2P5YJ21_GOSBA|nr:hypothetical protein GOBAR_AA04987 [Gossypium barbadense]